MNRTIYILLFSSLISFSSLHAQWISIEGAIRTNSGKNLETVEDFAVTNLTGLVQEMDTIYIRRQLSGEILNQQKITTTINGSVAAHLHIPIIPKWTGKIGLGISQTSFLYRDVLQLRNFNEVVDTIDTYSPDNDDIVVIVDVNGGTMSEGSLPGETSGNSTPSGMTCDTVLQQNNSFRSSFIPTRNFLIGLTVPISVSYELIPGKFTLNTGAQLNFTFDKGQSYSRQNLDIHHTSTEDFTVCDNFNVIVRDDNPDIITNFSVTAFVDVEAKITNRLGIFARLTTSTNSITRPEYGSDDRNLAIPYNYRPVSFSLGAKMDLFFNKNPEKRRTNYLIKKNQIQTHI